MRLANFVAAFLLVTHAPVFAEGHGVAAKPVSAEKQVAAEKQVENSGMVERPARNSSRDVKVPKALVHQIETEYRAFLSKNEVSTKTSISRKFLNLSVELSQKHPVALHEDTRIVTPLGGGVVDFAEYVTPLKGSFSMKILAKKEDLSEASGLRVFFVSKSKARRLDGEQRASGGERLGV